MAVHHEHSWEDHDEHSWEEQYRAHPELWSGRPNAQLVAEASDAPVGAALDIGCGEGADAIWLADRGWRVTAVDFSATALARARTTAASVGAEDRTRAVAGTGVDAVIAARRRR